MIPDRRHIDKRIAIWAITANGVCLGQIVQAQLPGSRLFHSARFETDAEDHQQFETLKDAISQWYEDYDAHLFIMATGIVVRLIAPFLKHKFTDPAVVVMDEQGQHTISLVSGHLGGANALALTIADIAGAKPVITTATDVNGQPAIDILAQKLGMCIETPAVVAPVNMAIIHGDTICLYDPCDQLTVDTVSSGEIDLLHLRRTKTAAELASAAHVAVCIDYRVRNLPDHVLVLRPRILCVGIGCNRNTPAEEIGGVVKQVFTDRGLSLNAVASLASIDIKRNETGLIQLANKLGLTIDFFSKSDLDGVAGVTTPSVVVEKHVGVKSVCEAAAIRSALGGELIVTKQRTANVTVAVACRPCLSSV